MAVTVQMQFESAVTELYQDAFVGSSIEHGTTIIQFDLRKLDFQCTLGTTATICWRKEPYHVDIHELSTFHNPVLSLDSVYEYERALSANAHGTLLRPNTRSVSGAGQGVPHPFLSDPPKARPMGTAASALLGAVVGPTAALLGCWVPGVRGHLRLVRGRRTWGDVQRRRLTPARGGRWQQVSLDGAPAAWSRSSRRPSVPGGIEPGGLVGP